MADPIRCRGECGRLLPEEAFRRNRTRHGKPTRRRRCRDCEAGRPIAATDDTAALVLRYEALRRDCLARRIRPDDRRFLAVAREVATVVLADGPIVAAGIRLGWDWERDEVSRGIVRA